MKMDRTAFCIFCDDVRMEMGNKPSYMGIYAGGEIQFSGDFPGDAPVILPKFAIIIWFFCAVGDLPDRLNISVYSPPGRTEIINVQTPDKIPVIPSPFPDAERISIALTIPINNMQFNCSGTIEVILETERETIRAGRLRVLVPGRPDPMMEVLDGQIANSDNPIEELTRVKPARPKKSRLAAKDKHTSY